MKAALRRFSQQKQNQEIRNHSDVKGITNELTKRQSNETTGFSKKDSESRNSNLHNQEKAALYLDPMENCPISQNLKAIKQAKKVI